jgi:hypothetical protein
VNISYRLAMRAPDQPPPSDLAQMLGKQRLTVGVAQVQMGHFNSIETEITAKHIMASEAQNQTG